VFGLASRHSGQGVLLVTALVFRFILAYLASIIRLAPIVGACAAGPILEEVHFRPFANRGNSSWSTWSTRSPPL
jgi:Na+:H+ antiporter